MDGGRHTCSVYDGKPLARLPGGRTKQVDPGAGVETMRLAVTRSDVRFGAPRQERG